MSVNAPDAERESNRTASLSAAAYARLREKGHPLNNRLVAERLARAIETQDMGVFEEVHARDVVVSYPQSGETIRGIDNYRAMLTNYPGGLALAEVSDVHGQSDDVIVTSSLPFGMPIVSVSGADDSFILEGVGDYGDDGIFYIAAVVEIRNGKVAEEKWYFAPPFEPPAWRAAFVET